MQIIETPVYTFDELSDEAKEKAREWWLAASSYDNARDAYDQICQDARQIGLEIIALSDRRMNSGNFIDGAVNCAHKIMAQHGEHCETYKTAEAFIGAFCALPDQDDDNYRDDDFDAIEADFKHSLLEDYRIMYGKELEYTSSNEYIDDNILANEYTFTEEGKRFG